MTRIKTIEVNVSTGERTEILCTPAEEAEWEAREAAHAAEAPAREAKTAILNQIATLEASITNRRVREAVCMAAGKKWLANTNDQIAALRAQL